MATPLPVPYKSPYSLKEFWDEFTKGTMWKQYKEVNPKESDFIRIHVEKKIAQAADFVPKDNTHTYTGNALLMILMSLH